MRFKVEVLKTFKISTNCHIKICCSLKWRAIFIIPSTVFRRTYALSVGFKMKTLRKSLFQGSYKNQPKFCYKTCCKEQPFIIAFYLMNEFFKHVYFQYVIMECIELNWLCKHMKKVRCNQADILAQNWIKHNFSLWVSLIEAARLFTVWTFSLFILLIMSSWNLLQWNKIVRSHYLMYLYHLVFLVEACDQRQQ